MLAESGLMNFSNFKSEMLKLKKKPEVRNWYFFFERNSTCSVIEMTPLGAQNLGEKYTTSFRGFKQKKQRWCSRQEDNISSEWKKQICSF